MIADLHATQEERHKEVCEAIRELTAQLNKAKTDHAERKSTLLDETQKQQLLAERTRVDDNIRRRSSRSFGSGFLEPEGGRRRRR